MKAEIIAGKNLKSLKRINSSSLIMNANQVHRIHRHISVIIAIICFEERLSVTMLSKKL